MALVEDHAKILAVALVEDLLVPFVFVEAFLALADLVEVVLV